MYALRRWSVRHAGGLRRVYDAMARRAPALAPWVRALGMRRSEVVVGPIERLAKETLFDCRMCGQCVLSSTGMACPMNCAKEMRNGPCGGVRSDGTCEVRPDLRCVWLEAGDGARRIAGAGIDVPDANLAPLDRRRQGSSTWLQVICEPSQTQAPAASAAAAIASVTASVTASASAAAPAGEPGAFETACRSGQVVVTVEVAPPDSADPLALVERASRFEGLVDAINITDGAGGNCHMSSVAASAILVAHGMTPVYQVACRDRNRIAIQGDVLGAAALGVRDILCLTGDDVSQGDHPQAKPVFDLDAVSLLGVIRGMRDRSEFASGRRLDKPPRVFVGATANPFVPPYRERVANLAKKVDAGAQFIQTQFCFDLAMLEDFMRQVRDRELHRRCRIIVGVGTLRNARALQWMAGHVPGVYIPPAVLERIARSENQQAEAKRVCIETIQAVVGIEGVAGVHLMGHRNEDVLADIIVESGLRRRASPGTA